MLRNNKIEDEKRGVEDDRRTVWVCETAMMREVVDVNILRRIIERREVVITFAIFSDQKSPRKSAQLQRRR